MSQHEHKIYNHEVNPPAHLWEKIVVDLDSSELDHQYPSTLQESVATPPAGMWDRIASAIEEPIAARKLYDLEVAPPASAWKSIAASLGGVIEYSATEQVPVTKVRTMSPVLRYAIAALFIGLIAFGGFRLFNTGSSNASSEGQQAIAPVIPNTTNNAADGKSGPVDQLATQEQPARHEESNQESRPVYASMANKSQQRIRRTGTEDYFIPAATITSAEYFAPQKMYKDLECTDVNAVQFASNSPMDMASRYTMLMTPDGHIVRVSKKLGDFICCVSGEEVSDDCKDQLKKWRQRLANTPVAGSTGNFTDLLDLMHLMKENSL